MSELLSRLVSVLWLQSPSGRNSANMQKHSCCVFPTCQPAVWVTPVWNPAPMQSPSTASWVFTDFYSRVFVCIDIQTHTIHTHIGTDYIHICVHTYICTASVNDLNHQFSDSAQVSSFIWNSGPVLPGIQLRFQKGIVSTMSCARYPTSCTHLWCPK